MLWFFVCLFLFVFSGTFLTRERYSGVILVDSMLRSYSAIIYDQCSEVGNASSGQLYLIDQNINGFTANKFQGNL